MANSNIVGVKYIGSKQRKEDNVAGTGAVWAQGQVINFTVDVANKLTKFSTVWELTKADPVGETYLGSKKSPSLAIEPVPFININEMDADSLVAYARIEFNRVLDGGTEIEALRKEVHGLMVNQTLDEIQDNKEKPSFYNISLQVTEAERDAFLSGDLILRLVPKLDEGAPVPPETNGNQNLEVVTVKELTPSNSNLAEIESKSEVANEPENNTNDPLAEQAVSKSEQEEPLEVTLAKLDKRALRDMCKELGIPVSNTMTEDMYRKKLLDKAGAK